PLLEELLKQVADALVVVDDQYVCVGFHEVPCLDCQPSHSWQVSHTIEFGPYVGQCLGFQGRTHSAFSTWKAMAVLKLLFPRVSFCQNRDHFRPTRVSRAGQTQSR